MDPADCGNRFAKGNFVGIDDAQVVHSEVRHGARGGADVQRIARGNEDNYNFGVDSRGSSTALRAAGTASVESKLCVARPDKFLVRPIPCTPSYSGGSMPSPVEIKVKQI